MRWSDVNLRPTPRQLRQFAAALLLVFGGLAGWHMIVSGPTWLNVTVVTVAAIVGITGLAAPAMVRPLFVVAMVVTFPIGWIISNFVLLLLFFLLFTPLALWFRLIGRDALRLRKPHTDSYWLTRQPPPEPRRYTRQY